MATIINSNPIIVVGGFLFNKNLHCHLYESICHSSLGLCHPSVGPCHPSVGWDPVLYKTPTDFLHCALPTFPDTIFIDINTLQNINSLNDIIQHIHVNIVLKSKSTKNINLIGYSMGGLVAIDYAHRYPDYVTNILLINSTPRFIADTNWHGIKLIDCDKLISILEKNTITDFCNYFIKLAMYPKRNKYQLSDYVDLALDKHHLLNLLNILKETDLCNEISEMHNKLTIIYSEYDVLVPYNQLPCKQIKTKGTTHINIKCL